MSTTEKPSSQSPKPAKGKDFLTHLELYLAKRDGVDKLLKISRYAAKIIVATGSTQQDPAQNLLISRLKSFESSVGLSRKAFRLGKFVQDLNALRQLNPSARRQSHLLFLHAIAYGGEGLYYFIEQLVWLVKTGLIDKRHLATWQKWSAWCEFVGYFGSVGLKVIELREIADVACNDDDEEKIRALREKKLMKGLSIAQDFSDGVMALADIRDGRGALSGPAVVAWAGLASGFISAHKNWSAIK